MFLTVDFDALGTERKQALRIFAEIGDFFRGMKGTCDLISFFMDFKETGITFSICLKLSVANVKTWPKWASYPHFIYI